MSERAKDEVSIKVGFEKSYKEINVTLPEGDVPPWQPGDRLDVVGSRPNRLDAVAKVTGRARYTYDRRLEGLLYGKILRCPHPHARVKSVDVAAAESMQGVHAVLSFPEVFRTNVVRFAWDGVAAVAAESEAIAEEALRRIVVDYETLPFAARTELAMKDDSPAAVEGQENVVTTGRRRDESPEDFEQRLADQKTACDAVLAESAVVVEGEYATEVQLHCALEPHGNVCDWDGDRLLIYASTQGTFGCRDEATSGRGPVRAAEAHVISEYVGGGFGAKFGLGREGAACALLAKKASRPVKLMLDRREEQTSVGNRPDSIQKVTLGVDKNGKFKALRAYSWGTAGTASGGAGARNHVIYDFPVIDKVEYAVRTNAGPAAAMRAPGFPQGVFAMECLIDDAAEKLGVDPMELRKKNDSHPIRQAQYDLGAERIGWQRRNKKAGAGKEAVKRGLGMGSTTWFAAGGGGASALVRVHKDGRVEARSGCQDIGTGTRTVMGMVAAEELGLPLERVQTFIGDTNDPMGPGSGGSTTIGSLLPAMRLAAHNAKLELLRRVAEKHEWKVDEIDLRGGKVVRKDGKSHGKDVSFEQACAMIDENMLEINERRPVVGRRQPNYEGFAETNAGVQFAEVEVDTETGEVRVLRVVAIQDCGKIINEKLVESQIRGGVIGGVSYALFERRTMDRQEGRMVNADMENYKILGPKDMPEIDVIPFDVYNGKNNVGVMGLGEPPKIATAAAVANAVYNAIGVRITSLPITPKKVLEALASKEKK